MKLKPRDPENFYAALQAAGMPEVPREFSVVPQHQSSPTPSSPKYPISFFPSTALLPAKRGRRRPCAMRQQLNSVNDRRFVSSALGIFIFRQGAAGS